MDRIQTLVQQLQMLPHPEGGFYAETWRSGQLVDTPSGPRPAGTSIYFLLTSGNFSAFHRIKSDEGWHHYEGDPVHIHSIDTEGNYRLIKLGSNMEEGETYQAMVPAHCWFASESKGENGYALVGCTVAPGFSFEDFELARKEDLNLEFTQHKQIINRLTR